jgi:single-strand DNA-binding protein
VSWYTINRVTLLGNLTRDPELRTTPSGFTLCDVRIAVNERVKNQQTDEWMDRPNFFNVTIWGKIGENVHRQCSKGSVLLVEGKLRWREWDDQNTGQKRQAVDVIGERAIPLARMPKREDQGPPHEVADHARRPDDEGGPWNPGTASGIDDDIPF